MDALPCISLFSFDPSRFYPVNTVVFVSTYTVVHTEDQMISVEPYFPIHPSQVTEEKLLS